MDLIGKSYVDYFIAANKLDGASHQLKNFSIGGLINIFKDKNFKTAIEDDFIFDIFLICNSKIRNHLNKTINDIYINYINIDSDLPTALILEKDGQRSSFVINDNIIEINSLKKKNLSACVFYADKIKSNIFESYNKLYLDTAGNNTNDLYELASNSKFPRQTILSISSEYLRKDLLEIFINNDFTIISHSPTQTEIYSKDSCIEIYNNYHLKNTRMNKNFNITGLGDKYFFLIAMYNYYNKLTLKESVIKAQKIISLLIKNML